MKKFLPCFIERYKLFKFNVEFSLALFQKAIEHGIPVDYASSASVYGNNFGPLCHYAMTKGMVDQWVIDNMDNRVVMQISLK